MFLWPEYGGLRYYKAKEYWPENVLAREWWPKFLCVQCMVARDSVKLEYGGQRMV